MSQPQTRIQNGSVVGLQEGFQSISYTRGDDILNVHTLPTGLFVVTIAIHFV